MKPWIFLIDDEADLLQAIRDFLEDEGFLVSTAANGEEAIKKLTPKNLPDLIILDMKMPIMDGRSFAKLFHEKYDNLSPIVLVSGDANAQKNAQSINANGWIEKPFKLDELLKKIKEFIT
jgi:CheY-like chemotaxis protein